MRMPKIIFLLLLLSFVACPKVKAKKSRSKRLTYAKYLKLDEGKKEKAAKKSVKKKGNYFVLDWGRYITHTDIDKLKTLEMTVLMDNFYSRFASVFKGKFKRSGRPNIFVLANREAYGRAYRKYTKQDVISWSAGVFVAGGRIKPALFGSLEWGEDQLHEILFHEGTHQLLYYYIGNRIPVWFNEGMATNFESWELERSAENNRANTIYKDRRIPILQELYPDNGFVKFRNLIKINSRQWQEAANPGANYASAFATCNFFLATGDGRTLLNLLIKGFRKGQNQNKVINEKMIKRIEEKLDKYVKETVIPNLQYGRKILPEVLEKNNDTARKITEEMLEKYPLSKEGKFFQAWLALRAGEKTAENLKVLLELQKDKNFEHPEQFFALAEGYLANQDFTNAYVSAWKASKAYLKHEAALEMLEQLKDKVDKKAVKRKLKVKKK